MKREEAEQLTNHLYRLYTSIKPVVDTSPPVSFYSSPKSTFYTPFSMRKQKSGVQNPQNIVRRKGKEELAHFLNLKRARSQSQLGFNSFARLKTESCLNLSELDKPNVRSKLLDSRNYQPPLRIRLHSGDSPTSSSNSPSSQMNTSIKSIPLPPKPKRVINREPTKIRRPNAMISDVYEQFKDRVLSEILLRNVYTNSVIEDCFRREIERHPELRKDLLLEIMKETLTELGIQEHRKTSNSKVVQSQKHVKIAEDSKRKMRSLSSGSRTSSSIQTSSSSQQSKTSSSSQPSQEKVQTRPTNRIIPSSSLNFRINVSPPRTISSLSSDIDEIVRRLSTTESVDVPEREHSLDSFDDDETDQSEQSSSGTNDKLNDVIEKAKRKS